MLVLPAGLYYYMYVYYEYKPWVTVDSVYRYARPILVLMNSRPTFCWVLDRDWLALPGKAEGVPDDIAPSTVRLPILCIYMFLLSLYVQF